MTIPFSDEQIENFWSKVDKTPGLGKGDCWLWMGARNKGGYGRVTPKYWAGQQLTHRVSYWLSTGSISEYDIICHKCNFPLCLRPEHLYAGTNATNGKDRSKSLRAARLIGEANGSSIFTWAQVHSIRTRFTYEGVSIGQLAKQYKCSETAISDIINNRTYTDSGYEAPPENGRGLPKLTMEKARLIRKMFLTGKYTLKVIGKQFDIGRIEVGRVVKNEIWINPRYTPPADISKRTSAGKSHKGEDNGFSKLTWGDVRKIRADFQDGITAMSDIAKEYGVDPKVIALVIDNLSYVDQSYAPPRRKRLERGKLDGLEKEIYRLHTEDGVKQKELADRYGVSKAKICKLIAQFKE